MKSIMKKAKENRSTQKDGRLNAEEEKFAQTVNALVAKNKT